MTDIQWKPTARFDLLRRRSEILESVRAFFRRRDVLEVETPCLSRGTVTDLHLHTLSTIARIPGETAPLRLFLQTSPEFAMKRLLAAGSGPIFQICKAFRDEEAGRMHNPEFTMLEWYRPDWDHHLLMDEVDAFAAEILSTEESERVTYRDLFLRAIDVDPLTDDLEALRLRALDLGLDDVADLDREGWLSLLMTHVIEPNLGRDRPVLVYDYPADQAALARIRPDDPPVAERFELYVRGVELANGYHELTDPAEQRRRFERDLATRAERSLPIPPVDRRFLAALDHGLPPCSGVALGLDRLVMLALGCRSIAEVSTFPIDRA